MELIQGLLFLEGGAFRGIYTTGVLDVLLEEKIHLEKVLGVSAGSLNALGYLCNQPGIMKDMILENCKNPRYNGYKAILENRGAIGFKYIFGDMLDQGQLRTEAFLESEQKFLAAVTNCETGKPEFLEGDNLADTYRILQASSSMQYLCRKVRINEVDYLDGGISTNFGLDYFKEKRPSKAVFVLTNPLEAMKDPLEMKKEHVYQRMYRKNPNLIHALERRANLFNRERYELKELQKEGALFVIAPEEKLKIARIEHSEDKLLAGYEAGRQDAQKNLEALRKYLV